MKDYIYPLHNVTLSIALGEERTARMYSPTPASGLFLQGENKKNTSFLCVQLRVIRTSRDDVSVSTTLLNITYKQISVLIHHMTNSK